jgi:anaerobic magnesium-protoporphyrin IX monomethyl ester cyclase
MSAAYRNEVLVIVPPNSNTVIEGRLLTVTRPEEHSDWSDFLCLGALSLVSALADVPGVRPVYIDATIIAFDDVLSYITGNSSRILAVCLGVLTANYEAGLIIARYAKQADSQIVTVAGNDHFTALAAECMGSAPWLDYGFAGNEVVGPFVSLISALRAGAPVAPEALPGLAFRAGGRVRITPQRPEPVFSDYSYGRIDEEFPHSGMYARQFARRIAPRVRELLGRDVHAGVPVDLGRGCVKFAADDACSFCSIQFGNLWRNQLSPGAAWEAITAAWASGYDYLYLTADELPLTFATLLTAMGEAKPAWWNGLAAVERPLLVGYARADGIADPRRTQTLADLGIRQVMIGMDAGATISLAAMNKPVGGRHRDVRAGAEKLHYMNSTAIKVARDHGMLIRAGFVVGHIGMTPELLRENLDCIQSLIAQGRDVFSAVDVEVLSPQPGAMDFRYLTDPAAAKAAAGRLGLPIGDDDVRADVASRWLGHDVIVPELAMRDYARALMPGIPFEDLAAARSRIRDFAKESGVVVGE